MPARQGQSQYQRYAQTVSHVNSKEQPKEAKKAISHQPRSPHEEAKKSIGDNDVVDDIDEEELTPEEKRQRFFDVNKIYLIATER